MKTQREQDALISTKTSTKCHSSHTHSKDEVRFVMEMEDYFNKMRISSNMSASSDVASVYSQDKDGDTFLHLAIIQGDTKLCEYFISIASSVDLLNLPNHLFQTPLHVAVITRRHDIVRRLLTSGVSRNCRDMQGNTPLHIACREGFEDIVAILLCGGTNRRTYSQDLELRNFDGNTCLHLTAMSMNFTVLDLLIQNGADVNAGDNKSGRTILHFAVELGNVTLTNYLMQQTRLDINKVTYAGKTALSLAAGRDHFEIVDILLSYGADSSRLYMEDSETDESDMEM